MPNRKPFQLCDQFLRSRVQILQRGILDLVDAFDLADQQLRIADQLERFRTVLQSILKRRDQALIFSKIVRLVPEIFAQRGNLATRLILDDHAVTRRPRIPARPAIAMSDQIVPRRIFARLEEMPGVRR